VQQEVSGGVGELDPAVVGEADDPDAHEVGQVGDVADLLVELELRCGEAVPEPAGQRREVGVEILVSLAVGAPPEERRAGRIELPLAVEGPPSGDRQPDGEQSDDCDEDPLHSAPSIAQRSANGVLPSLPPSPIGRSALRREPHPVVADRLRRAVLLGRVVDAQRPVLAA
jgi:hypothetical protein